MGKVVQFRPRKEGDGFGTEQRQESEPIQVGAFSITIPSLDQLYDEAAISLGEGMTVADFRERAIGGLDDQATRELSANLELHLFLARGRFITDTEPDLRRRKPILQGLGEHTFAAGLELDSELLRERALGALTNVVGARRAKTITENLRLKHQLKNR